MDIVRYWAMISLLLLMFIQFGFFAKFVNVETVFLYGDLKKKVI